MKKMRINYIQALDKNYLLEQGFRYGWVMELNRVQLNRISDMNSWDDELVVEARFFAQGKELHIYGDEEKYAVLNEQENIDDSFTEMQLLKSNNAKSIIFRHYVGYDEDGQAQIMATCLDNLILKGEN